MLSIVLWKDYEEGRNLESARRVGFVYSPNVIDSFKISMNDNIIVQKIK